jgi:hypothetical protein
MLNGEEKNPTRPKHGQRAHTRVCVLAESIPRIRSPRLGTFLLASFLSFLTAGGRSVGRTDGEGDVSMSANAGTKERFL